MDCEIQDQLEDALTQGLSPESEAGGKIVELHRRWLSFTSGNYDPAKHRGMAQLYVPDERFQAYYDKNVPGYAKFITDAVYFRAKKNKAENKNRLHR